MTKAPVNFKTIGIKLLKELHSKVLSTILSKKNGST